MLSILHVDSDSLWRLIILKMAQIDEKMTEQELSNHIERKSSDCPDVVMKEEGNASGLPDDEWKAAEKRLVRKLDMTLVPILWVFYLFNYLDRNNIA